ncbi:hypothetical protein [Rugosimonospora africana]|uniref:DUF1579 domain-containing protein n=1 Tax=Rugosimonospora africana TaxID=556532 RepID=A0A8J3QY04_9ACTN|nr:hypothetical protein [Rugosimonospora africana]GIH18601.1 hypothetical protein Raf01_67730 [Rugosimonospora africana]
MEQARIDPASQPLAGALLSGGPAPGSGPELAAFGQFVGDWVLRWSGRDSTGTHTVTMDGTLSVGWILGGTAVQDVWAVPLLGQRPAGGLAGFHGTTVRFYDPGIGAWRSTWIDPPNARVRRFVGRIVGADIELVSDEEEPLLRWRFSQITGDSFVWTGEIRPGRDADWSLQQEVRASRGEPRG